MDTVTLSVSMQGRELSEGCPDAVREEDEEDRGCEGSVEGSRGRYLTLVFFARQGRQAWDVRFRFLTGTAGLSGVVDMDHEMSGRLVSKVDRRVVDG